MLLDYTTIFKYLCYFDKEANEPFDIMIQDKTYFKAYLAKSIKRYALSLTDIVKKV